MSLVLSDLAGRVVSALYAAKLLRCRFDQQGWVRGAVIRAIEDAPADAPLRGDLVGRAVARYLLDRSWCNNFGAVRATVRNTLQQAWGLTRRSSEPAGDDHRAELADDGDLVRRGGRWRADTG